VVKQIEYAVAWLREEDWPRWLAIDSKFQPDYSKYIVRMEAIEKDIQARGGTVKRIVIEPDAFLTWSAANGGRVDTKARAAYAAFMALQPHKQH
jgi:hypothetical protein